MILKITLSATVSGKTDLLILVALLIFLAAKEWVFGGLFLK